MRVRAPILSVAYRSRLGKLKLLKINEKKSIRDGAVIRSYHIIIFSLFGRGLYFYQKRNTKNGIINAIITADAVAASCPAELSAVIAVAISTSLVIRLSFPFIF